MDGIATDSARREVLWALGYFAAYMVYNFAAGGESEFSHWLTLVAIPVAVLVTLRTEQRALSHGQPHAPVEIGGLVGWARRARRGGREWLMGPIGDALASIGLRRGNLRTFVGWAVVIGLGISVLQSLGRRDEIFAIVLSGRVFYLYPIVVVFLFLTAGFTEEVLFRGVLQTRLQSATGSATAAIVVTSVLFSIYHLPYAYLKWNSAGDWGAAFQSAFANGMLGGVVLGVIYLRAKHNLLATVIVHTLINSVPALTIIKFGG